MERMRDTDRQPSATRGRHIGSTRRKIGIIVALAVALGAAPLSAQSALTRPPDMSGGWVGAPGTLYFHFLHRFEVSPGPVRKITNYPTFLLGVGLPGNVLVGAHYATNSLLVPGYPNEWEFFTRYQPLSQSRNQLVDVAVTEGYNLPARSFDGELAVSRDIGRLRLLAAGRGFSSFRRTGDVRWALAGGAVLRLNRFVALAADVSTMINRDSSEEVGWGAGLQLAIPYTPHTLSLQVSNTNTTTLENASLGSAGERHWGFEFTIPLTLSRYFGSSGASAQGAAVPAVATQAATEVTMTDQLRYDPAIVHVKAGQTVRWTNGSVLIHTVTLDTTLAPKKEYAQRPDGAESFNSGNLKPGDTFAHTFTVPGEYVYFCIPHGAAGMIGRVIVDP